MDWGMSRAEFWDVAPLDVLRSSGHVRKKGEEYVGLPGNLDIAASAPGIQKVDPGMWGVR